MTQASRRLLVRNILANYAYVGVMALVTLFVVPCYLRLLGAAQWGNVALCITLQGLLFSLDMALGPLMLRDVARAAAQGRAQQAYRRFLRWYALPALGVFALGQFVLEGYACQRAASSTPLSADLLPALRLALLQFAFQFANNAAIGYWSGREQQGRANRRLAAFALTKHAAALSSVLLWQATAVGYMLPFALISAVEFGVNAWSARRDGAGQPCPSAPAVEPAAYRDVLGYAGAALLAVASMQIDRAWLSFALPTPQYGGYVLVSSIMLSMLSLQMPIQRAFLPRLATSATPHEVAGQVRRLLFVLLVVPALLMAAFPEFVLRCWLHDAAIAAQAAETFRLLLIAVALMVLAGPTALLLLHRHRNATMARLNAVLLATQLAILLAVTPRWGMLAGAVAWAASAAIQLGFAVYWHRVHNTNG